MDPKDVGAEAELARIIMALAELLAKLDPAALEAVAANMGERAEFLARQPRVSKGKSRKLI